MSPSVFSGALIRVYELIEGEYSYLFKSAPNPEKEKASFCRMLQLLTIISDDNNDLNRYVDNWLGHASSELNSCIDVIRNSPSVLCLSLKEEGFVYITLSKIYSFKQ